MLGWWVDEAKGYRLKDLENKKLITSRDVHFFEDDSPSELAVIEVGDPSAKTSEINDLVDNAITKESNNPLVPKDDSSSTNLLSLPKISPSDPSKEHTPDTKTMSNNSTNLLFSPALCHSSQERKAPSRFALTTVDNTIMHGNINTAFIAVAGEPKTYQEAIQSPHSKQ